MATQDQYDGDYEEALFISLVVSYVLGTLFGIGLIWMMKHCGSVGAGMGAAACTSTVIFMLIVAGWEIQNQFIAMCGGLIGGGLFGSCTGYMFKFYGDWRYLLTPTPTALSL